ncbi:hypothetical protein Pint_27662 [Pistacia integerrima]|uniref:Uncharacterized protein n=1 Tax=Pistacia integerrima TaxID=434235 RepID=A0ACC0YQ74_9ROSI|nr:hypothetical protein Pint_27662 [Pistacia integerrima]
MANSALIFEIKTRIWEMNQESESVTAYHSMLNGLWQELDQCYDLLKTLLGTTRCLKKKGQKVSMKTDDGSQGFQKRGRFCTGYVLVSYSCYTRPHQSPEISCNQIPT